MLRNVIFYLLLHDVLLILMAINCPKWSLLTGHVVLVTHNPVLYI